jgi:DNA-binding GntR family transcriptional regulator
MYEALLINDIGTTLLKVLDNLPAFYVERVGFDLNKKPLEFVKSIMKTDRYEVSLDLTRD